jgi:hypothetical protein
MALFNSAPSWLKFLAMGAAASGLLCSLNLLFLFQANLSLIATTARWPRSMAESSSFSN